VPLIYSIAEEKETLIRATVFKSKIDSKQPSELKTPPYEFLLCFNEENNGIMPDRSLSGFLFNRLAGRFSWFGNVSWRDKCILTPRPGGSTILLGRIHQNSYGEPVRRAVSGFVIFVLIFAGGFAQSDEDCLKVNASISPRYLSRGQEGKVVLKITVAEGITINPQPSFIIECDPSYELIFPKNFFTASDLEIEIIEENGDEFLDLEKPVEIPFTVSLEAKRGNHSFGGRIKFFAFSEQDDWCLKSTAKFTASFYTRSTRIKKN
jgi:hypothetical protein